MELFIVAILIIVGYFYYRFKADKVDLSMLPEQFIVFDLETTGLRSDTHEIIEIAAIKVNTLSNKHQTFQALVKPKKKIPKKITELTGITQKMVDKDGDDIEEVLKEFIDFIGDLRLVAFNAPFDMSFLLKSSNDHGIDIKNPVSCALEMFRKAFPDEESYKLVDIAKRSGFPTEGAHRALNDCRVALPVYTTAASALNSIK